MKTYSFLIVFLIAWTGFSQNYKGDISPAKTNGLHKILLPTNIRSASQDNFNFLRLNDASNTQVPYVLIYDTDKTFTTLKTLEIVKNTKIKDSVTSLVLANTPKQKQTQIALQITNTNITKRYDVFGSYDGSNWFGLVANKNLSFSNETDKVTVEKIINIPLNDYAFFKIDFNDKNTLPINILSAGVYESKFFKQEPIAVNDFSQKTIELKDKKVTQIKFSANNAHKINVVSFKINTDYFLRQAKLIVKKTRTIKNKTETYKEVLNTFQLNANNKNTFAFFNLNEKEFYIEIANEDNPPLDIENITLFQKPVYLITNLKEKTAYNIIIDSTLQKPSYDLKNFISKEIKNISEVNIINFEKIKKEDVAPKNKMFWETKTFMWVCLVLGGLLVGYFALGLLKDIDSKEK